MITTKRQIKRESDRFGGYYGTENGGFPLISDFDPIGNDPLSEPIAKAPEAKQNPITDAGSSMLRTDSDTDITTPEPVADNMYTTLETERARPQVRRYAPAAPVDLPPRQKKKVKREKEDLLPTVKTRAYASDYVEEDEQSAPEKEKISNRAKARRAGIDMRTKVILCVYVAVALILAIAVIATGVIVSRASVQADDLAASVSQKQAIIAVQNDAIAAELEAMPQKAADLGMVPASGNVTYSVSAVEKVDLPVATPKTDAFDRFCDWLSKVIN